MRNYRAKVIDYLITADYIVSHGMFLIKNPRDVSDWTVFFQPLYTEAWIGLIIFTFFMPVLISFVVMIRK